MTLQALPHPTAFAAFNSEDCVVGDNVVGLVVVQMDGGSVGVKARAAVAQVKPGVVWLAESVHASFVSSRRAAGLSAISDCELFEAFDLEYDYDIWPIWQAAVVDQSQLKRYLDIIRFQDCIYPGNYVKMRCVENHDQPRIQHLAPSRRQALAWTAFQAFNKGAFLIYDGQEAAANHTPSLFDVDKIAWNGHVLQPFLTRLTKIKKDPAIATGQFTLLPAEYSLQAAWLAGDASLYGVFNVAGSLDKVAVQLPDGVYTNLIDDQLFTVSSGQMPQPESAAVFRCALPATLASPATDFFEFNITPA